MTTENQDTLAGVNTASEQEATAALDANAAQPEVANELDTDQPAEKTFTQAEVDALVSKRLAKEHRKLEREQAAKAADSQIVKTPTNLEVDQFESTEAYAEALAYQKAEELLQQRELRKHQESLNATYAEREESARDKYDDFEQVAYNPKLRITDAMAETIKASDIGPDLAYWLGSNPNEAARIAVLPPLHQAKEIGKIEAKLADNPPVKKSSSAPAPISPVSARTSSSSAYDTTDPRSVSSMSTSEWIEAERQRQMKKLRAQTSR